ncbi:MAG TPA: hypothetical protein VGA40_04700, partial [Candidatus Acidoferrales bacterium]
MTRSPSRATGPRATGLRVVTSPDRWLAGVPGAAKGCALTIGVFDGVHLGHQHILERVADVARTQRLLPAVVTFDPHPLKVLRPAEAPPLIETLEQRLAGFRRHGIRAALVLTFDAALSRLSAQDFVRGILVEQMRLRAVLVGENFRFGHRQAGDVGLLRGWGARFGFTVEIVEPVGLRGEIVSSTSVRAAIGSGDVARAARLLG